MEISHYPSGRSRRTNRPISEEERFAYVHQEGLVTPLRSKTRLQQKFCVAYGFGPLEQHLLLCNPTDREIRIKKHNDCGIPPWSTIRSTATSTRYQKT